MPYLFAAFSLVWLGLFLYLVSLANRQRKLLDEIRILKSELSKEEN